MPSYVGFMMYCGDVCDCWVPVVNEIVKTGDKTTCTEVWRGTFLERPNHEQKEKQREELETACLRYHATKIADVSYIGQTESSTGNGGRLNHDSGAPMQGGPIADDPREGDAGNDVGAGGS